MPKSRRDFLFLGAGLLGSFGLMGYVPRKKSAVGQITCVADERCAERQAQLTLPKSPDLLWPLLKACKVERDERTGNYSLEPTPEVKAMNGKTIRIKGFTVPLDGSDKTSHYLIAVNTPVCFYHPPGEPNEIIEVMADSPLMWDEKLKVVEGTFTLVDNGQAGVFFRLLKAHQIIT